MTEINHFNFLHYLMVMFEQLRWIAHMSRELFEVDSFILRELFETDSFI
jgi:hypothetical protein